MGNPTRPLQAQPFLIPDCRRPGEPMLALPLKLPQRQHAQLQAAAVRMGTSRTALGRALLLAGLAQLPQANTTAGEVVQ
jgi:hypothetical protein